jgi:carbamoyl-phosphate synthase large subunit
MKKLNVLVTGVGGGGHGEQILKALRLSNNAYHIIGGDMSPLSKGLVEVDEGFILPPANDDSYIDVLIRLCKVHNVSALFHGSEPELIVMDMNRDKITNEGIFLPINPSKVIATCMDKYKTFEFLKNNGFDFPKTYKITHINNIKDIDVYPVVLKPSIGGGGSANTMIAQSKDELIAFSIYLLKIYSEFVVQEYVGTPDSEFTVGVLNSMDGEFINSIAVKRYILSSLSNRIKVPNRTGRKELGEVLAISSGISQGEIGKFDYVTRVCEEIALLIGARGAINFQCRFFNNKVYIFEINPRFSGTTSLRAMVGYNEPDILIRKHIFNERIETNFKFNTGYIMRGLSETYIHQNNYMIAKDLI